MIAYKISLVKVADSHCIVFSTRHLDHIAVIVNVLALLLQDESFKELCQNTISGQKLDASTVCSCGKNLGNQVSSNLLGLSRQDSKGEFSKLWCGVFQKQCCKDHSRAQAVDLDGTCSFGFVVPLYTLV